MASSPADRDVAMVPTAATTAPVQRWHQVLLIATLLPASWLGMQDVHEFGHIVGCWLTGARVAGVVLNPLTISRTDIADNPSPLIVVWAGPLLGCVLPLAAWGMACLTAWSWRYLPRFFAGFCLIANGAYIAVGSFDAIGDAGVMLRHGSPNWALWLFGIVTVPIGLGLWHKQGKHFGLDPKHAVSPAAAYACALTLAVLLVVGFAVDGD